MFERDTEFPLISPEDVRLYLPRAPKGAPLGWAQDYAETPAGRGVSPTALFVRAATLRKLLRAAGRTPSVFDASGAPTDLGWKLLGLAYVPAASRSRLDDFLGGIERLLAGITPTP